MENWSSVKSMQIPKADFTIMGFVKDKGWYDVLAYVDSRGYVDYRDERAKKDKRVQKEIAEAKEKMKRMYPQYGVYVNSKQYYTTNDLKNYYKNWENEEEFNELMNRFIQKSVWVYDDDKKLWYSPEKNLLKNGGNLEQENTTSGFNYTIGGL